METHLELQPPPLPHHHCLHSGSLEAITMSNSSDICPHCGSTLRIGRSVAAEHLRLCMKYIFPIHQDPLKGTGPTTLIQRRPQDNYIVCQCIDTAGKICTQAKRNKKQLWSHLTETGNKWHVSIWNTCLLALSNTIYNRSQALMHQWLPVHRWYLFLKIVLQTLWVLSSFRKQCQYLAYSSDKCSSWFSRFYWFPHVPSSSISGAIYCKHYSPSCHGELPYGVAVGSGTE